MTKTMVKTNKFSNLKRLDLKNKGIVLGYLIKTALRMKSSQKETDAYLYYNYLISNNGYLVAENKESYTADFKDGAVKRIKLRKKPSSDILVFDQIYCFREYQPVVEDYKQHFGQNPNQNVNIIDAGSNIGLTSLFFSEHFEKPSIIAIEPDRANFGMLGFNLQSAEGKIVKINGAVWCKNTFIKIVNDFRDQSDWAFRVEESADEGDIQAFTINQLAADHGFDIIDILKIDIEGSEKQIFDPQLSDLSFLERTKCIAIEIHDEFDCRQDIYTLLTQYGFTFREQGELTIGINHNLINKA